MAIYHLSGSVISRSKGKSCIASAAYRSGELIYDERQGRGFDYTRKQDIAYKEIILPPNAPVWMLDRQKLWNAVESSETRKDSQLAREFNFALPRELTKDQNIALAREFIQNEFTSKGMIADLCIHDGKSKTGEEQPHAHVMLTLREVSQEGFGLKQRSWNAKENLLLWRESWAEHTNKHLALNDIDQRIDHRTLEEQGIDLEPQKKIGSEFSRIQELRILDHKRIAKENGDRILEDPNIALKAITYRQSTFTYQDIARFINSNTIDAEQFQLVYEKVKASDQIITLTNKYSEHQIAFSASANESGVREEQGEQKRFASQAQIQTQANQQRLTTKEMFALEQKMLIDAAALTQTKNIITTHKNPEPELLNQPIPVGLEPDLSAEPKFFTQTKQDELYNPNLATTSLNTAIDSNKAINPNIDPATSNYLSEQQQDAVSHLIGDGDIKCLIGYAGTGKSRLLSQARDLWEQNSYRVHGATLSGIAAENLEASSDIESRTLASRCYYWDQGKELLTKKDILVIDEAGMLGSRQLARVLNEVRTHKAKLIIITDPQQLQAIEAGAASRSIAEQIGYFELTEIRRQQEPWQQEATKEFALRNTALALNLYDQHNCIRVYDTQALAKDALINHWNTERQAHPDKSQIMLSFTRRDAQELNEMARVCRQQNNELGENQTLQTINGAQDFAINDRIYFLRNDRTLGVKNGTLGTIQKIDKDQITVRLDKFNRGSPVGDNPNQNVQTKTVIFNLNLYNHITHGYAATIHKAQGTTVDQSFTLASKHLDSHAIYVAMTRHKEEAYLYYSQEEFASLKDLERILSRDRSKDVTQDYCDLTNQTLDQDNDQSIYSDHPDRFDILGRFDHSDNSYYSDLDYSDQSKQNNYDQIDQLNQADQTGKTNQIDLIAQNIEPNTTQDNQAIQDVEPSIVQDNQAIRNVEPNKQDMLEEKTALNLTKEEKPELAQEANIAQEKAPEKSQEETQEKIATLTEEKEITLLSKSLDGQKQDEQNKLDRQSKQNEHDKQNYDQTKQNKLDNQNHGQAQNKHDNKLDKQITETITNQPNQDLENQKFQETKLQQHIQSTKDIQHIQDAQETKDLTNHTNQLNQDQEDQKFFQETKEYFAKHGYAKEDQAEEEIYKKLDAYAKELVENTKHKNLDNPNDLKNLSDFQALQKEFERNYPDIAAEAQKEMALPKSTQELREKHAEEERHREAQAAQAAIEQRNKEAQEKLEHEQLRRETLALEEIKREHMSPQEKQAEKLINKYYAFEEKYKAANIGSIRELEAKNDMKECAREIYGSKHTMNYLKNNNSGLFSSMNSFMQQEKAQEKIQEKQPQQKVLEKGEMEL